LKTPSWDVLELDRRRMAFFVALVAVAPAVAVVVATLPFIGQLALALGTVVGAASAYTTAAIPRRVLEKAALLQAREAPTLAASGAVYLQGTGSKSKTVLMLHSEEPMLSSLLEEMKRRTLLGIDAADSLKRSERRVRSESALRILRSVVRAQGERLQDEGEELESVVRSSVSGEETKFPVFMTIAFFLPIMLMIFAAMERHTEPLAIASLAFLEIVVLDLALSISSTERRRLSA
jgi:hypothetical protein